MIITPNHTFLFGVSLRMKETRLRSILHSWGARRHVQASASIGDSLTWRLAKARSVIRHSSTPDESSPTSFETKEVRS